MQKNLKLFIYFVTFISLLILITGCSSVVKKQLPHIAYSFDGVPISYQQYGNGDTTLVFVHGWSCDSRYWKNQIRPFSEKYKVITIDLAGHGHSGVNRKDWTIRSFGEDVKAVIEQSKAENIILIGHSLGGPVVGQAADLLRSKAKAVIGIDTLQNVEYKITPEEADKLIKPFETDFKNSTKAFVGAMFVKESDPDVVKWVSEDMSSAPEFVALGAFRNMFNDYMSGEMAKVFERSGVPVYCINANLWPNDPEANKRHIKSFTLKMIDGTGHFPMLEKPAEFNKILNETIEEIIKK